MATNVTYLTTDPTKVHSIGKFLPSEDNEVMFQDPRDLKEGVDTDPRFFKIEWDGEVPTVVKKSAAAIQAIKDADAALQAAQLADQEAYEARNAAFEEERSTGGLSRKTPQEIRDYIDNQFDAATTNTEIIEVIKTLIKKLAIYAATIE
jgi:hypothetical protein